MSETIGPGTRWEAWIAAYIEASTALPGRPGVRCPSGDRGCVRVTYLGDAGVRTGTAVVWCPECRQGSFLSRVAIPVGAQVVPLDATDAEMAAVLPADIDLLPAEPGRRP